ncbi:MAG: hypothetical protein L6V81_06480 [Clostridium sp.]|nr:MAG: hypothetical protein L6V81_06480 [Clostridium sp.]
MKNEIVIDKVVYNNLNSTVKCAGILTINDILNRDVYLESLYYKIVGIVDMGSPSIYTYESEFTNIIALSKDDDVYGSYIEEKFY